MANNQDVLRNAGRLIRCLAHAEACADRIKNQSVGLKKLLMDAREQNRADFCALYFTTYPTIEAAYTELEGVINDLKTLDVKK